MKDEPMTKQNTRQQLGKTHRGAMPPCLDDRIKLSATKADGFRILRRILRAARLTDAEAEKVRHCFAPS